MADVRIVTDPGKLDLALSVRNASIVIRLLIAIVFVAAAMLLGYGAERILPLGGPAEILMGFGLLVVAVTAILAGCFVIAPESRLGRLLAGSTASIGVLATALGAAGIAVLGMILLRR